MSGRLFRGLMLGASVVLASGGGATAHDGQTQLLTMRVSVSTNGLQGNGITGRLSREAVDADGTVTAFDSAATNLVKHDTNKSVDVFVHDASTGRTTRVSVSSAGVQGNGDSARPDLSGDGRYVVFDSTSTNLTSATDQNGSFDVFVRDLETGTTSLVSATPDGGAGNSDSFGGVISRNGRWVAFTSDATDLSKQPVSGARDILIRNLRTGRTTVASIGQDGNADGVAAHAAAISANGRYVAFSSFGSSLVGGDTNDAFDVFLRDRKLDTTSRVSVDGAGAQADGNSDSPAISDNGSVIAFSSDADNLVSGDTNGVRDIFAHDMHNGTTVRVSVDSAGDQANNQSDGPGIRGGLSFGPDISGDGDLVTFDSIASNLIDNDTNTCSFSMGGGSFPGVGECPDVFVHDLTSGTTVRASVASDGTQSDSASTDPVISSDGSTVAFFTAATNLGAGDTNTCAPFFSVPGQCPDIYVHQG